MIKKLLIFVFFVVLICSACYNKISKSEAKEKMEELFQMKISDDITVSNYESNYSITSDYTETFVVHFSKEEFQNIFSNIKPLKFNNIDVEKYGYTIEKGDAKISAIFDPQKYVIKYSFMIE